MHTQTNDTSQETEHIVGGVCTLFVISLECVKWDGRQHI